MMVNGSRLRQIGWAVTLAICFSAFMALTFKVNSVKSEVRLAERRIVSLQQEKTILETEFETRASQHQLAQWTAVRVAQAPEAGRVMKYPEMVSPLTGKPVHNRVESGALAAALAQGGELLAEGGR